MNNDFDSDSNSDSKNSWTVVNETIDQKKVSYHIFLQKILTIMLFYVNI